MIYNDTFLLTRSSIRRWKCLPWGEHRLCLNHGEESVSVTGFDLLKGRPFTEIEPYGVALTARIEQT